MVRAFLFYFIYAISFFSSAQNIYSSAVDAYAKGDYVTAKANFKKAAEQGNKEAQTYLGFMFKNGLGGAKNLDKAVIWYQKAVEQGWEVSQTNLGSMYFKGLGVTQDKKKAINLFEKAAAQGYARAQSNLGILYENGDGVIKSLKQAKVWHEKAAEQGFVNSQRLLGDIYRKESDFKKAQVWYRKSAVQGDAVSQRHLGNIYKKGYGEVKPDFKKAMQWYKKAIDNGDELSKYDLGVLYHNGDGVVRDFNKALSLYKKSNSDVGRNAYVNLKVKVDCINNNDTKLFNVVLKCANRLDLRKGLEEANVDVILENNDNWGDAYITNNLFKGSSKLTIDYTYYGSFAFAHYTFPESNNKPTLIEVKDFVVNKYGKPTITEGSTSHGEVSFTWGLEDGIELKVHRGWPDKKVSLYFIEPNNLKIMVEEKSKNQS